jgi:cobalt/nickel transport system permease protein
MPDLAKWRSLTLYFVGVFVWISAAAMHIPDGYLSPATDLVMFILVLPFWTIGVRRIRETMNARNVPLIALMAAFSFVIMMFNVPLPGGTTGHAVGAALAAIVLGPEAATIAVSIALIIQAFFFGDGGVLAIGANCFNMAVVVPYVAYAVYQAVARKSPLSSRRRPIGAALGGWLGLTIAAFLAGVEFGVQPILYTAANGTPLYAPYPLAVSVPAMVIPHALVASVVEGLMTALVVAYLQRSNVEALQVAQRPAVATQASGFARLRWLWAGLLVLIVASPLGLLAPGTAWGEWSAQELQHRGLQSVPAGMERLSSLWGAPLAGYHLPALGNANLGYLMSAVLGIAVVAIIVWLFIALITIPSKRGGRRQ